MDREQAISLNDHVLDVYYAMDDVRVAIAGLGKADRLKFNQSLYEIITDLQQKLLAPIYDRYPDLEPPIDDVEPPEVSSELTWNEVQLPPSVTEADLDDVIFSLLKPRWQKTAMLLFNATKRCEELAFPISREAIAARLKVLSDSDRIEGIGDLQKWGHSEVRLKD